MNGNGKADLSRLPEMYPLMVAYSLGMSKKEAKTLAQKSGEVIERLATEVQKLSGMDGAAARDFFQPAS